MPKIAVVTDIHYGPAVGYVQGEMGLKLLKSFIEEVKSENIDLLIDLGDRMTEENPEIDRLRLQEIADEFKKLPFKRQHLRGNHDLLPLDEQENILQGKLTNRVLEIGQWQLIFFDCFKEGTIGGEITIEKAQWLAQQLAKNQKPTIIFSHQPLFGEHLVGNIYFEKDFAAHACPSGIEMLTEVIQKAKNIKLYVSGHTHWSDFRTINNKNHLTVPSLSETYYTDGQPAETFAMITLADHIEVEIKGKISAHFQLKI